MGGEGERERKGKVLDTLFTSVSISWILSMVYDATGGKLVSSRRCQLYLCKKEVRKKIILCTASRKGRKREREREVLGTKLTSSMCLVV